MSLNYGYRVTVYTNGVLLKNLPEKYPQVSFRVSTNADEKRFNFELFRGRSVMPKLMVNQANAHTVFDFLKLAEGTSKEAYIYSMRDLVKTGDYWVDTEDTYPMDKYIVLLNEVFEKYNGPLKIHVATRGVVFPEHATTQCRFGNILPDGQTVRCPLDIGKTAPGAANEQLFDEKPCNKCTKCVLHKAVFERD